jgi:hypothetical protein
VSNKRHLVRPERWKDQRAPTLGTVRTWMRHAEEDGAIQRAGVERTGEPGRPATLWEVTPAAAAEDARKMSGRELARERARLVRSGRSDVWLAAVQAEIQRRRD